MQTLTSNQLEGVSGGIQPKMWTAMNKAYELGLNIHWMNTGPHYPNSRHWRGRAIDIGGSPKQLAKFFAWARGTHPHELIYKNMFIKDGHRHRPIGGHNTHVHYSI